MSTLFEQIHRDHEALRQAASGPLAVFREAVRRHATAEGDTLYVWMSDVPEFADDAARGFAEHAAALRALSAGDVTAVGDVLDHVDHEEQVLFPEVKKAMPIGTQRRLGEQYEQVAMSVAVPPLPSIETYAPPSPRATRTPSLRPRVSNPRVREVTAGDILRGVAHRIVGLPAVFLWKRKRRPNRGCIDDSRPISLRRNR